MGIKDMIEEVDMVKVRVSVGLAVDLIQAGSEILDLIKKGREIDEVEILEIIEKHNSAKSDARLTLIESIKRRKEQEKDSA